jgi:hypothetical protein
VQRPTPRRPGQALGPGLITICFQFELHTSRRQDSRSVRAGQDLSANGTVPLFERDSTCLPTRQYIFPNLSILFLNPDSTCLPHSPDKTLKKPLNTAETAQMSRSPQETSWNRACVRSCCNRMESGAALTIRQGNFITDHRAVNREICQVEGAPGFEAALRHVTLHAASQLLE